mgnify:CR=1 FL=1
MKHLIILTTIIFALLTLTGCGGANQAQQAAPNQAANQGQQAQVNPARNLGAQVQANQQALTPVAASPARAANTGAKNQVMPQNSNIDFKKMTDDQIDQKYDQLKESNSTTAVGFGMQAWASRFPEAANKKPADNLWSREVMQRNRNQANTQGATTVQNQVAPTQNQAIPEETPLIASSL